MKITIDPGAGPCFGVQKAIDKAEEVLKENKGLVCMGDLIHNEAEISRLSELGMKSQTVDEILDQKPDTILFRAHGEPPASYDLMSKKEIKVIDATCPIVLNLQKKIRKAFDECKSNGGRIVIYGQKNHAEVISLQGNCDNSAIVIENLADVENLDLSKPVYLFSQTTKYRSTYQKIYDGIVERMSRENISSSQLHFSDSSCKIVARRDEQLQDFVKDKDVVLFVSGSKSSNGKQLFQIAKNVIQETYFITQASDIQAEMIQGKTNIGISGATSTPKWLLEDVAKKLERLIPV